MSFELSGKRAVITGGASGIGKAIAVQFAKASAHVHILDLRGASETVDEITREGGVAKGYEVDVSDQSSVKKIFDQILSKNGIDILVNCAGVAHIGNIEKTSENDFNRLISVNVKGYYNTMFACIPHMREKKQGVILNIASVSALVGIPDRFAYSMTKGAVIAMSQSVARDYVESGIRCNTISPARIHTPFVDGYLDKNYPGRQKEMYEVLSKTQPIGRMGKPEEVAFHAQYLCSDEAGFATGTLGN